MREFCLCVCYGRDWDEEVLAVASARCVTGAFPSPGQHIMRGFHLKKPYGLQTPRRYSMFWYDR